MRSELYRPKFSDRENREKWRNAGAKDAQRRATEKVQEILANAPASIIPEAIRKRIKQEIPGLRPFIME